jgi:beta-aspartyl-peptidase (threonine type)
MSFASRSRRLIACLAAALAPVAAAAQATAPAPSASPQATPSAAQRPRFMLVVHGGAGTITRAEMTPQKDSAYRTTLTRAIRAGYDVLDRGGASLDAVRAVINVLEDSPLFNAGKGAVFTNAGTNELDAAIMDGSTLKAGAVAGVKHVKNPIDLARLVMERSPHVMLVGAGAEAFAKEQGMALVPQSYFFTKERWESLQKAKAAERRRGVAGSGGAGGAGATARREALDEALDETHGTVGAVALDAQGNLAAGTSTGGTTNKRWGRVGDSPIIGAGTYANNQSCAVSATGTGEYFIRNVVAHDICARMLYQGVPLAQAADEVVMRVLVAQNGDGGVIAVDKDGNIAMPFNTEGMYRGYVGPDGRIVVKIYKDE